MLRSSGDSNVVLLNGSNDWFSTVPSRPEQALVSAHQSEPAQAINNRTVVPAPAEDQPLLLQGPNGMNHFLKKSDLIRTGAATCDGKIFFQSV